MEVRVFSTAPLLLAGNRFFAASAANDAGFIMERYNMMLGTDRDFLVALPFRAGMWMSNADQTGGPEAQQEELAALINILTEMAQKKNGSEFVDGIMKELNAKLDVWDSVPENLNSIEIECRQAIALMMRYEVPVADMGAYRNIILEVARRVAASHSEFDASEGLFSRLKRYVLISLDNLVGMVIGQKYHSSEQLRISVAEDIALTKLDEALRR